ncbi:MAG: DEAD/DEAH box helicase [Peptostreptococcaceae bacterium]|jgi:ATP-dependent RNA helicase DeaD|nr:DEAD/DEAH box helicase [Peptostreptococcaceae bacterium]
MDKIKFNELECSSEVLKAIEDMGFEEATSIQSLAIPVALSGVDMVGQAQTGTGKTAAFGIPAIEKTDSNLKKAQVLILCPTRELALQVSEELVRLCKYKKGINILSVFGGQSIERQIKGLKKGAQIIVGTPGRVMDHMRRKTLKLDALKMLILDEADEMLNMGFREDIETIMSDIPNKPQTLLFSATMPKAILDIINKYQKDPQIVKVAHKEVTSPNIEQYYMEVREGDKMEILTRLLDTYNPEGSIIFCNTKRKVDDVGALVQVRGYTSDKIHGDMQQNARLSVIERFKRREIDVLVATDVAARGLDIEGIDIVFNYDMPGHEEYYVHRIGRTGRAGREGKAFTFVLSRELRLLKNVMRYTKKKIALHDVPTIAHIANKKTEDFLEKLKEEVEIGNFKKQEAILESLINNGLTSYEIACALLKMELEIDEKQYNTVSADFDNMKMSGTLARIFVNIGNNKRIKARDIVGAVAGETGIKGRDINNIDIYDEFSFFEVPAEVAKRVVEVMDKNTIRGKKVSVEIAKSTKKPSSKRGQNKSHKSSSRKSDSRRSGSSNGQKRSNRGDNKKDYKKDNKKDNRKKDSNKKSN